MTVQGYVIRVSREYVGAWLVEAITGDESRDPVRVGMSWTASDAAESFCTMIGAMRYHA